MWTRVRGREGGKSRTVAAVTESVCVRWCSSGVWSGSVAAAVGAGSAALSQRERLGSAAPGMQAMQPGWPGRSPQWEYPPVCTRPRGGVTWGALAQANTQSAIL